MLSSVEIRDKFLQFFKSKEHTIVPSAPIVVKNDPTLMFTNAGMNQFKEFFLGEKEPSFTRIADTQKCLRVSGKHNDLEEVGVDTYHHTMFEMLGNWSFGDYFKKEAIAWSWELLTEVYKIDKDRLYVTIFEGDEKENLPRDNESYEEWKKLIAEDRILLGNKKDNFWEMGDTGPCGSCTEIHVDCRTDEERKLIDGKTLVNNDHPQVIEIWNNVFIQFNRKKDGTLENLPAKHVDTGMGFERLVRVLQKKSSNYDTDIFTPTIKAIEKITGLQYDGGNSKTAISFRVSADHIRAICFTIADGQLPSNTGAGYVIRRILRRAVRYNFTYLNYKQGLLYQLVPTLASQFENVFPELKKQEAFVQKVIKEEEDAFLKTLDKGLKTIDELIAASKETGIIDGEAAFILYDTYGFPKDLTMLIAQENNLKVDEEGFDAAMAQQKNRSRAATTIDTEDWIVLNDGETNFIGYNETEAETEVLKYRKVSAKGKTLFQVATAQTPCYAESGGQVGDKGTIAFNNELIPIVDTKKENNLIIHFLEYLPNDLSGKVKISVDRSLRKKITAHHSATHLMHSALRKVLGTHVAQKGSLVTSEYLRFDFSHFQKMTDDEIKQVEILVNEKINENIPIVIKQMPKDEAIAMGAMALFGEKYADVVRVVIIDPNYSIELCGGTHVGNTSEIGLFKIVHESSVAAGVRRIEAISGQAVQSLLNNYENQLHQINTVLKNPKDNIKAIEQLQNENAILKQQIEKFETKEINAIQEQLLKQFILVNGVNVLVQKLDMANVNSLKKLSTEIKSNTDNSLICVYSIIEGKIHVVVTVSEDLQKSKALNAGNIVKQNIAVLINGGGGGNAGLASAAGAKIDVTNEQLKQAIGSLLTN